MKILITGATGLIGRELVTLLLANQHTVHYLTTSKSKVAEKPNLKGFYWNPQAGKIEESCIYGVDAIIHLAGANIAKRWTKAYKQEIIESRVLSTRLLYNALQKNPNQVKQIVSASAIGIYSNDLTYIYHETDTKVDDSFLGNVVQQWEEEVNQFEKLNIKVTKIRIGIVLAKNGGALQEMVKPIKMGVGAAFGSGLQYQSWIHIQDLAGIFHFVIQNQLSGIFNGVAPYPVTNSELTKAIAKTLSKPLFLPNIPQFVMKIMLGEMHQILFSSQHVSCRKLLDLKYQFKFASLDKALNDLFK